MKYIPTIVLLLVYGIGSGNAAEYLGNDIDGESYPCTGFSHSTSDYYDLTCEFSEDKVTLYFSNGSHAEVTMDFEEIDDPSSVRTFDYSKGTYWNLSVDL